MRRAIICKQLVISLTRFESVAISLSLCQILWKQRLKITRTLAAKHDLLRRWLISPLSQITVSNHKQWSEAHFLPVHKIAGLAVTSRDLSWMPARKFSLCFLPLRNFIILKRCRKQFAIMAVVGKVDKVEIDEKLREWKRLIHKAIWLNTLLRNGENICC